MHARIAKIRIQALLLSAVPLLFLVLLAVLAAVLVTSAQRVSSASREGTALLSESDALTLTLAAASRGIDDYVSLHRRKGLTEYADARARLPAIMHALLVDSAAEPAQRANAQRYVALSRQGMIVLQHYLALVVAGRQAQARAFATTPAIRALSTQLNDAKTRFDQTERALTIRRFTAFSSSLRSLLIATLFACLLGIVATVAVLAWFGMRIVGRLELLARNVRRLGASESATPVGGDDEIAVVDRLYQEITARLREALRQKEELLSAYEREHHVASTLQQALLPQDLPVLPGVRIDAAYVPAAKSAEIGGDWYDVFTLSDRLLAIGVGDVAGHDLRAATVMGAVRQAIRIAAREDADPASVLTRVNRTLCLEGHELMVTAFFGVLDLADGTLRYVSAGHPAPIVVTPDRDVMLLKGSGVALGIYRRFDFATQETRLGLGSAIVLYTDGMVEAERDYDRGMARLEDAVRSEAFSVGGNIAHQILERAFDRVEPRDDAAVLFVGITELDAAQAAPHRQTWRLDAKDESAAHRVKRALLWHLGELASPASDFASSETIIGELVSNVARHTPGPAEVTLECDQGGAVLHVCDRGRAFRGTGEHAPDVLSESGRGLFLVRALARGFEVVHTAEGNRVSVVLPVSVMAPVFSAA